jgi:hypothetical protein
MAEVGLPDNLPYKSRRMVSPLTVLNPANIPPTDFEVLEAAGAANGDRIAAKAQLSASQR